MVKQELEKSIADKSARIGVIGLGYVGLPLIVEFGLKGFEGIGFEVDARDYAARRVARNSVTGSNEEA